MNRAKRVLKNILLSFLAIVSISMIATAPQPLSAAFFIILMWTIGYFVAKYRKHIFGFMNADIPLKAYVEKQAVLKKEENHRLQNPHLFTLDALNLKPLTEYETSVWNQLITDLNSKEK